MALPDLLAEALPVAEALTEAVAHPDRAAEALPVAEALLDHLAEALPVCLAEALPEAETLTDHLAEALPGSLAEPLPVGFSLATSCLQRCKQCWKTLAQCLVRALVLAWRWISLLPTAALARLQSSCRSWNG